jgi:hypothetical protein
MVVVVKIYMLNMALFIPHFYHAENILNESFLTGK